MPAAPARPQRRFVITGGPGSGKSTLVSALNAAGYTTTEEVGRRVIKQQVVIGGRALPWRDPALFAEMMLSWEIDLYQRSPDASEPCFHDRGVPDVIGYLRLMGLPVPAHMISAAELFRYAPRVFLAPAWPEIFEQDAERKQDFAEAQRTCAAMKAVYPEFGYELVELPKASVAERVKFCLERLT